MPYLKNFTSNRVKFPNIFHGILFSETPGTQRSMESSATATPGGASSVSGTPFRDQLNINPSEGRISKKDLQEQFQKLPKPRNEFELAPVGEEDEEEGTIDEVGMKSVGIPRFLALSSLQIEFQRKGRVVFPTFHFM